jgi:hypothetical protein
MTRFHPVPNVQFIGCLATSHPLRPLPGGTPLGRGSDGRFGLRWFRAKLTATAFGTHHAFTHALPPSLRPPFRLFARVALFFLAAALVKEKTSRHRQKGKNMKLEEVNLKTKEAVDYLVQSLESGQSAVLTQYLGAMAKFRNYSFLCVQ